MSILIKMACVEPNGACNICGKSIVVENGYLTDGCLHFPGRRYFVYQSKVEICIRWLRSLKEVFFTRTEDIIGWRMDIHEAFAKKRADARLRAMREVASLPGVDTTRRVDYRNVLRNGIHTAWARNSSLVWLGPHFPRGAAGGFTEAQVVEFTDYPEPTHPEDDGRITQTLHAIPSLTPAELQEIRELVGDGSGEPLPEFDLTTQREAPDRNESDFSDRLSKQIASGEIEIERESVSIDEVIAKIDEHLSGTSKDTE